MTFDKFKKSGVALAAAALLIGLPACKQDFLDREPLGRYTEDDLAGGSFESQVFGMYAQLRSFGSSALPYIAVHNIRSDDADKGSSVGDGTDAESFFDNFNYTKDFWLLNDYYTSHFALVGLANNIISDVDSLGTSDPATLVNRGEAKFMRAYAYFNLVRAFGEVPLVDFKVTSQAQANVPKSSVAEIYALIDADLQEAAGVLPLNWPGQFIGRLTSGAANALRAKTYLYREQWANALAAAKQVIASGQYSLHSDYQKIFTEEGENSPESIFEIQAHYTPTQNFGSEYANVQGVRGAGAWDLGWGWNTPSEDLADAFEPGDPRKDATLLYSGQVNTP
ncbi:MAG TPA: RagB/SusD family nutrient uptake outer membrane protein, partial [Chitinophagaceae bacterium]|nr:RagB/SusD family nutrient uptake outer membrane protein [Chitinophagaceae bacterium]